MLGLLIGAAVVIVGAVMFWCWWRGFSVDDDDPDDGSDDGDPGAPPRPGAIRVSAGCRSIGAEWE